MGTASHLHPELHLRPGETAGMFAPEGSALVGRPCGMGEASPPPAFVPEVEAEVSPAPWLRGAEAGVPCVVGEDTTDADRLSAPLDAVGTAALPGVTYLTDLVGLAARSRMPDVDLGSSPDACYGGGVSGTGDVEGPASATDNALARYDGASGKVIQNSGVTLGDQNEITGASAVTMAEQAAALPVAAGQGQFWVKNDAPSAPRFTSDDTVDHKLMLGSNNLGDISSAASARSNLGLVIGTNVQAFDEDLAAIAALGATGFAVRTAADTWAQRSVTGTGRVAVANGNGVAANPVITIDLTGANKVSLTTEVTGTLPIANGGTGATTAAAAATNLGLGTGDSPQFTAVNIGHASDTTITRVSAGNLAVEGNTIYRAGGTDVAIADGGTGASLARDALSNLGTLKSTVVEYTGSGSSGKTVTLTGVNRAHWLLVTRQDGTASVPIECMAMGATGSVRVHNVGNGGTNTTWFSLDAPSAGTAQVLTLNTTDGTVNASGVTYRVLAIGTST